MNPLQRLLNPKLENKAPFSAQVICSRSSRARARCPAICSASLRKLSFFSNAF
jgi:hypothetical protein